MAQDAILTLNQAAIQRLSLGEDDGKEPALSLAELMVLAIARSVTGRMTPLSIHQWLRSNFKYYAFRHEECQKRRTKTESMDYLEPCHCEAEIANQISGAFADRRLLYGLLSPFQFHKDDRSLSLVPGSAQLALFSNNTEEGPGFARYSDLPAELRLEILRHAFTFDIDSPGWKVKDVNNSYSRRYYFEATVNGRRLTHIKLSAMLSPLSVNKQMNAEAGSLFFTQNTFHFENCLVMRDFMRRLGPQNRTRITNVSLDYMFPGAIDRDRSYANSAFRYLAEANNLLHLRLNMRESNAVRKGYTTSARSFPGFHILHRLRGLRTVIFEGECSQAQQLLEQALLKPYRKRTGESVKSEAQLQAARDRYKARALKRLMDAQSKDRCEDEDVSDLDKDEILGMRSVLFW